jgi:hypothetical protein
MAQNFSWSSWMLIRPLRNSPLVLKSEVSLPYSQQSANEEHSSEPVESSPETKTFYLRMSLNINFHLCEVSQEFSILISDFPTKIFHSFFISHKYATCPAELMILDILTLIICNKVEELKI